MDASTRSFHVYGKTESGAQAIKASRRAMSTTSRRVLILIDGQRSVGELTDMMGVEAVETALAELESLGHVEFLRRFTDPTGGLDGVPSSLPGVVPDTLFPALALDTPASSPPSSPAASRPPSPPQGQLAPQTSPQTAPQNAPQDTRKTAPQTAPATSSPTPPQATAKASPPPAPPTIKPVSRKAPPPATLSPRQLAAQSPQPLPQRPEPQAGTSARSPAGLPPYVAGASASDNPVPDMPGRASPARKTKPDTISVGYPPASVVAAASVSQAAEKSDTRGPQQSTTRATTSNAPRDAPYPPAPSTLSRPRPAAAAPEAPPSRPAATPSPPAASAKSSARPVVKPVNWQRPGSIPTWARATLVVGGLLAIAVWLSARQFVASVAQPVSTMAADPAPAQPQGSRPAGADTAAASGSPAHAESPAPLPADAQSPAAGSATQPGVIALPADPANRGGTGNGAGNGAGNAAPVKAGAATASGTLKLRTQVTPEIPKAVRDRGITSGHVSVVLHVDPQGRVERVELLNATPPDVFDRDMEQVFGQWLFEPPGIPGRMTVDIDIRPPQ